MQREIVTIQYRGIDDELKAGDTLTVESCEGGVLRLRNPAFKAPETKAPAANGSRRAGAKGK